MHSGSSRVLFNAGPASASLASCLLQIAQWLTHSSTLLSAPSGVTPTSRLAALNVYLQPRAVLFGLGTTITVADIAAFSSIHRAVVRRPLHARRHSRAPQGCRCTGELLGGQREAVHLSKNEM